MDMRLVWVAVGGFAGAAEGGSIGGLLPLIAADMGTTVGQAGLLVFIHAVAYAFAVPVLVVLASRFERRTLLAGAELVLAAGAVAMVVAPDFLSLVASRLLLALGAGLYTSSALATAIAIAPPS